jgi:alpha-L-fucosidase
MPRSLSLRSGFLLFFLPAFLAVGCSSERVMPPAPVLPTPSKRQLAWQDLEFYAFVHFNMNTFTNMEWGTGAEDPALFNPTQLDCRQWVRTFKDAGMKGVIITAKHHDGFCLWPSRYTEHSVKKSPWRGGDGDLIRELADACRESGLKLGIYYSPWDRNHVHYGREEYIVYMRRQLKELLTQYGDIFEVWFDGANGGSGYYGGANEERWVDKRRYYDWETTYQLIRQWQPNAVIFSDAGPDVRWVGNEDGHSYPTIWSNLMRDSVYGGMPTYHTHWADGQENGTHWVPAETNVSIRPGWYYHDYEDHKVKPVHKLVDIYYESIGMNTPLLLNFPVDTRGLVHENDGRQLKKMMEKIRDDFSHNLALGARVEASQERGKPYDAGKVTDDEAKTYWTTEDSVIEASLTLTFDSLTRLNRFLVQEYIPLGQRVKSFSIEYFADGDWEEITRGTTIGYKRILRFDEVETNRLRFTVTDAKACPVISNIEVFYADPLLVAPVIERSKSGMVTLTVPDSNTAIYYTTNGDPPNERSLKYEQPFPLLTPGVVQAVNIDPSGRQSDISRKDFDISAVQWRVYHRDTNAAKVVDGNEDSFFTVTDRDYRQIIIDLGEPLIIRGFTYLPPQNRWFSGIISEYAFFSSLGGGQYRLIQSGEFSNIQNSPVWQRVEVPEHRCRFIKLRALKTTDDQLPSFAEIGVITK